MQFIRKTLMTVVAGAVLAGCSMMSEDMEPCPQGLTVQFVYDYNVERADMFNDHVGSVTLYVYDEQGRLVRTQTEDNTSADQPLRDPDYRMTIDGLQPGNYRLLALANQRRYADISQDSGIRYIRTGEDKSMTELAVTLNNQGNKAAVTDLSQQLDTLWHGTVRSSEVVETRAAADITSQQLVRVDDQKMTNVVVSMVRDTKRLHLSIRQSDDPAHCDIADYDITIVDQNGRLLWDNEVDLDGTPTLTYRPFDQWNTYYSGDTGESYYQRPAGDDVEETAHADLDFNRLMLRTGSDTVSPAILTIVHRPDQKVVAQINLPQILAQGRGAFERYAYSEQEFLDRAYDYRLDFILVGGQWRYMSLGIHTLPWTLRWQNVELD